MIVDQIVALRRLRRAHSGAADRAIAENIETYDDSGRSRTETVAISELAGGDGCGIGLNRSRIWWSCRGVIEASAARFRGCFSDAGTVDDHIRGKRRANTHGSTITLAVSDESPAPVLVSIGPSRLAGRTVGS